MSIEISMLAETEDMAIEDMAIDDTISESRNKSIIQE